MKVQLSLDAQGYTQGIEKASESTREYTNQVTKITKELPNMKREFIQAKKEVQGLTLAVSRMTDEQKKSAEGRAMIKMLEESRQKAAELQDMMDDTSKSIKRLSSDTFAFDAFKDSINGIGSAFTAVSGTIGLVTGEEDKMKQAMTGLATTMSVVNGLTSIQNLLQKESSVMLAISALQSKAKAAAVDLETVAQGKNIVATKAATAAQKTLNVVASANPYVLIATAVAALVVGYIAYADEINKLIGIESSLDKETKELNEAFVNESKQLADTKTKVTSLQIEWKNLKTEAEKKQWIEDNQQAFSDLGVEIKTVEDAENLLVKNTSVFLKAQELRAKALAYTAVAASKYQKAIENKELAGEQDLAWYEGAFTQLKQFAQGKYVQSFEQIKATKGRDMYDAALDAEEQAKEYLEKANELNKESAKLMADADIKTTNNNKTPKTPKTPKSSKKTEKWEFIEMQEVEVKDLVIPSQTKQALQKKLQKMQTELDTKIEMYIDGQVNPKYEAKLKEIKALQDKINNPQDPMDKLNGDAAKSIADGIKWSNEALQKQEEDAQRAKEATIQLKEQGYDALANAAYGLANVVGMLGDEEAAQVAQFGVNTAMLIADCVKQVAAMQAEAIAAGTASGAKLPFPANIAAIATIVATVLSIFSSLPKFEEGGIVGGHSFKGDKILARVNSGERILTKKQNDNLDKALDYNKLNTIVNTQLYGTVTVKGSDLNIAMKNFDKTQKKSR